MENNKKNELQINSLKKAAQHPLGDVMPSGELPDDALDGVAGGAVLDATFYIARCKKCGWQSCPFDNRGANDLEIVVTDHITLYPNCEGDFEVYGMDSRSVNFI